MIFVAVRDGLMAGDASAGTAPPCSPSSASPPCRRSCGEAASGRVQRGGGSSDAALLDAARHATVGLARTPQGADRDGGAVSTGGGVQSAHRASLTGARGCHRGCAGTYRAAARRGDPQPGACRPRHRRAPLVAQSLGFAYAPTGEPVVDEFTPLYLDAPDPCGLTCRAIATLEGLVTGTPGLDGVVLRYGALYGPGTATPRTAPPVRRSDAVKCRRSRKAAAGGRSSTFWTPRPPPSRRSPPAGRRLQHLRRRPRPPRPVGHHLRGRPRRTRAEGAQLATRTASWTGTPPTAPPTVPARPTLAPANTSAGCPPTPAGGNLWDDAEHVHGSPLGMDQRDEWLLADDSLVSDDGPYDSSAGAGGARVVP